MKKIKLLLMSLLLFIFAVACQAGEDNTVVYDDSSSGGYSESLYDTEDHDSDEDHDEDKEDHDEDKQDHDSDKDHDADEDHDSDEDHEAHDHDEEIIDALSKIEAIIEPENLSWPRKVLINDEEITITERPEKVLTISLGHDEILFGVSNTDQIAGTTSFAQEGGSNIEKKSEGLPIVTTDPETIISLSPDLVFADPYASIELMDTLKDVGIKVIQTSLNNSSEGRKKDVWLMSVSYTHLTLPTIYSV